MEPETPTTEPAPADERSALEAERDAALAERDEARQALDTERAAALAHLRDVLLQQDPAVPPRLVQGETAEEVRASFAEAKAAIDGAREEARNDQLRHAGGGAPGRTGTAPGTPFEKIRAGLAGR